YVIFYLCYIYSDRALSREQFFKTHDLSTTLPTPTAEWGRGQQEQAEIAGFALAVVRQVEVVLLEEVVAGAVERAVAVTAEAEAEAEAERKAAEKAAAAAAKRAAAGAAAEAGKQAEKQAAEATAALEAARAALEAKKEAAASAAQAQAQALGETLFGLSHSLPPLLQMRQLMRSLTAVGVRQVL
ncbi:hypothetical protein B484DRAFT_25414, partial [Ochromonadaceae sp. CCMP2298]